MLTYDEQITAADNTYHNGNYDTGEYCHEQSFLWGFQEGFDYCFENQWILCSQRMPEKDGQYLVRNVNCSNPDSVAILNWDNKDKVWFTRVGRENLYHHGMTHWADVPPFEKIEQNKK